MRWSPSSCCEIDLVGHLGLALRHLEGRPVGRIGLRLHVELGGEAPALGVARRQLVVELGLRRRPRARPLRRGPEPAADVRLDRLGVDALLADLRDEHRCRHLAGPEAGDLDALCEIVGRVCDRVVDVVGRNLDRQACTVSVQLLELRLHGEPLNQSAPGWGARARRAGPALAVACARGHRHRDPHAPHAQGVRLRADRARGRGGAARARALGAEPLPHRAVALPRARPRDVRAPRRGGRGERAREALAVRRR